MPFMSDEVQRELRRFDPELRLERAQTPPASWYTSEAWYAAEQRALFARGWQLVADAGELSEPGCWVSAEVGGAPLVVVRGADLELRAFHDVCRHKAAGLARGRGARGRSECFECPYHGWTYALDGRLERAPGLGRVEHFDRDAHGLVPAHVASFGPLIFAAAAAGPRPWSQFAAELSSTFEPRALDELVFGGRRSWTFDCNWKVFVDNYLDGGYHVPVLHRGLATELEPATYRTEIGERSAVQTCGGRRTRRVGDHATYLWLFPDLMLNRYGPVLDANRVIPRGPARTEVVVDFWFEEEAARDEAFVESARARTAQVQDEDVAISESVQRGLSSPAYDRGRYAACEGAIHAFHRWLQAELVAARTDP